MKNYRFYISIGLGFMLLYSIAMVVCVQVLMNKSAATLIAYQLNDVQARAEALAQLSANYADKDTGALTEYLQSFIKNSDVKQSYLSVFDWSGMLRCHPNGTKLNTAVSGEGYKVTEMNKLRTVEEILPLLETVNTNEVAFLVPILNSDLIIAGHINLNFLRTSLQELKQSYYMALILIGLICLIFVLIALRFISVYFEKELSLKSLKIEDSVLSLSKLNNSLENYQNSLKNTSKPTSNDTEDVEKERLLTYIRNELRPIGMNEIAYIYTENTITYIVTKDGNRSTSNESLDQIFSYLNDKDFFRVNRQVIIAISAITTIIKYGSNSLKINVSPESEIDIIIGKNKAAAFKKWLDL